MRFVMLRIKDVAFVPQGVAELAIHVELVLDPQGPGHQERTEPARGDAQIGVENALELEQRLVVERHVGEIGGLHARRAEAIRYRMGWESGVTLLTSEPLLLRRRHDVTVPQ